MRPDTVLRSFLRGLAVTTLLVGTAIAPARAEFVNFESGHTRPLALAPDGTLLFAVNTPDNRLSIFTVDGSGLTLAAEIPVGLEPVAVATRANGTSGALEAWVVNHLSDSVSVVEVAAGDLPRSRVIRTLLVGDEPRDVVFAGTSDARAFVTTARRGQNLPPGLEARLDDPGLGRALVWVFDAEATGAPLGGTPLTVLELFGDAPRALGVSPDGTTVYAAIFHSGNTTTTIDPVAVEFDGGYPPLPSDSPFFGEELDRALIVRRDPVSGQWRDELGRDFSPRVKLALPDSDVFAIDADADPPVLKSGTNTFAAVGTTLFNVAVRPGTGSIFVTNQEARNEVRFEPIQAGGVQGHPTEERITVIAGAAVDPVHVNPHIDFGVATGPALEREESLAGLNDLVFSSDGATLFVAAMGTGRIAAFDAAALEGGTVNRDLVDVGRGPTGLVFDEPHDRLYVLNHLDHTISVVSDASTTSRVETAVVALGFDPTPVVVKAGRPFLYDARGTSGHGDSSCASCHPFGDMDHLGWDLGDPYGAIAPNPNGQIVIPGILTGNPLPFHPVKGPRTTQSLRGMEDAGPMHWSGDRTAGNDPGGDWTDARGAFAKFNPAFVGLLGRATPLAAPDMQAFTDFIMTLRYPPNPIAPLSGTRTPDAEAGHVLFTEFELGFFERPCVFCHQLPLGTNRSTVDPSKVAHLRNLYQKVGLFAERTFPFMGDQIRGFGFGSNGLSPSILRFVEGFGFEAPESTQISAFLASFDTGLRPAVGQQVTISASNAFSPDVQARLALLRARDAANDCELTFSADVAGELRTGTVIAEGAVRLDRDSDPLLTIEDLTLLANQADGEQTYTCHPPGTGNRAAIDRDGDGVANGDEVDEGTDPADPASVPFTCTGGAFESITKPQLKITKNAAPGGDEQLGVKAAWTMPSGVPAIDPVQNGLNVVVRDGGGQVVLHRRIAGTGWTVKKAGEKWGYKAPKDAVRGGGITNASVAIANGTDVKVSVKGKASDFRIDRDDLRLEVVLGGDAAAGAGACATRSFTTGATKPCVLKAKTLKCG